MRELETVERKYVREKTYAKIYDFNPQTLANWRHEDLKAGRLEARPGFPQYVRFSRAVRYLLEIPEPHVNPDGRRQNKGRPRGNAA